MSKIRSISTLILLIRHLFTLDLKLAMAEPGRQRHDLALGKLESHTQLSSRKSVALREHLALGELRLYAPGLVTLQA
ncbi:MAG: hypothetical protein QF721_04250 [Verrucomicrobiota bacterium]|jgi:hypothetical protein|nr:hypothetical protein [Verrucomicrobiota bacterium]